MDAHPGQTRGVGAPHHRRAETGRAGARAPSPLPPPLHPWTSGAMAGGVAHVDRVRAAARAHQARAGPAGMPPGRRPVPCLQPPLSPQWRNRQRRHPRSSFRRPRRWAVAGRRLSPVAATRHCLGTGSVARPQWRCATAPPPRTARPRPLDVGRAVSGPSARAGQCQTAAWTAVSNAPRGPPPVCTRAHPHGTAGATCAGAGHPVSGPVTGGQRCVLARQTSPSHACAGTPSGPCGRLLLTQVLHVSQLLLAGSQT